MSDFQLGMTVAAVEDQKMVVMGFHNQFFSQAINLPVTTIGDMEHFALGLYNALVTEAEKVLGIPQPKQVQDAPVEHDPS